MKASEARIKIIHLGDRLVELRKIRYIKGFDDKRWTKCYSGTANEILTLYNYVEEKEGLSNSRKLHNVTKECVNLPRLNNKEEI